MTLKGFSAPLTPRGKSALATLPPWHYSSDCIAIEYWADPAALAALLPPGLTPDPKSAGRWQQQEFSSRIRFRIHPRSSIARR
jgi:acetoacetate decarboxylase